MAEGFNVGAWRYGNTSAARYQCPLAMATTGTIFHSTELALTTLQLRLRVNPNDETSDIIFSKAPTLSFAISTLTFTPQTSNMSPAVVTIIRPASIWNTLVMGKRYYASLLMKTSTLTEVIDGVIINIGYRIDN